MLKNMKENSHKAKHKMLVLGTLLHNKGNDLLIIGKGSHIINKTNFGVENLDPPYT